MDHADLAQEGIDNALADALAEHRRNHPARQEPTPPAAGHPPYKIGGDKGGVCIDCEEAIDPRRLAAHPAAIRCIDCQEDFERSQRL